MKRRKGDYMVYMKVHCDSCGGTWEVYARSRGLDPARVCPHCGRRIDAGTWKNRVLPAFDAVKAATVELAHDSADKHLPMFQVDFIADSLFACANKVSE